MMRMMVCQTSEDARGSVSCTGLASTTLEGITNNLVIDPALVNAGHTPPRFRIGYEGVVCLPSSEVRRYSSQRELS